MHRCLALAKKGAGYVAPNPMVGAVLVHKDRIIGEGWHQQYGEAHAEVNCITSVKEEDKILLSTSTLYVSLEPCTHFGKTPPCADLIIQHKIPKVIIGCRDPFEAVNGKGIEKLQAAGVEVILSPAELEKECIALNKRFFTFHTSKRPYVILKWAQTADDFIAASPQTPLPKRGAYKDSAIQRLHISNEYTNRLVHKWRSEEAAILVGTNTALSDNPELTTRLWHGPSSIRLVLDRDLKLPASLKIFNGEVKTIVFNTIKQEEKENLSYYKLENETNLVPSLLNALYQLNIQSVLVEGGAELLQSFIDSGNWDEIKTITNTELKIGDGLTAPVITAAVLKDETTVLTDTVSVWLNK